GRGALANLRSLPPHRTTRRRMGQRAPTTPRQPRHQVQRAGPRARRRPRRAGHPVGSPLAARPRRLLREGAPAMSLEQIEARLGERLINAHNVLVHDIERVPGVARVQHRGLVIEGDFWDLGSWKDTIRRRIHPDDVIEWPRTICAAWNWYGQER